MIEKFKDIKGFLSEHEGSALSDYCERFCVGGIAVEIGSYCGKSACYLGYACKKNNSKLFSVDHHHGSEEQPVSYTHLRAPRDMRRSRMPSSA